MKFIGKFEIVSFLRVFAVFSHQKLHFISASLLCKMEWKSLKVIKWMWIVSCSVQVPISYSLWTPLLSQQGEKRRQICAEMLNEMENYRIARVSVSAKRGGWAPILYVFIILLIVLFISLALELLRLNVGRKGKRKESHRNVFHFSLCYYFCAMLYSCSVEDFLQQWQKVQERIRKMNCNMKDVHWRRRVKYGVNNIHILKIVCVTSAQNERCNISSFSPILGKISYVHMLNLGSSVSYACSHWHHHRIEENG